MGTKYMERGLYLFSSVCKSVSTNECKECRGCAVEDAPHPKRGKWMGISRVGLSHPGHNHKKNPQHMYYRHNCTATASSSRSVALS